MRVPAGFQTYLKSIGFEDFQEPFVLEVKGKEYEFLTSDGKEITEFPGWDAITLACETALAIGVCRATRDLEELQGLIRNLDKEHGVYLVGFPPYHTWDMEKFKAQVEQFFAQ